MMNNNNRRPDRATRIFSVWFRHFTIYRKNMLVNAVEPFMEPLIFLTAFGLGMSKYLVQMDNLPYLTFLATGLLMTTAMFTSAFECTYGTFIRLEFDKVYDGMIAAPLSVTDIFIGELLWAGSKGFFFSLAVLCIVAAFGILPFFPGILAPIVGAFTGVMFGAVSLLITSMVRDINQFSFYFTGVLSPMFFFCGVVFPISQLPVSLQWITGLFPLTHSVKLARALATGAWAEIHWINAAYIILLILLASFLAIKRLNRKLVT